MASMYAVTVQIWAETPEDAVRKTIIAGSTEEAEVQDLAEQIMNPPILKVPNPAVPEDVLPL